MANHCKIQEGFAMNLKVSSGFIALIATVFLLSHESLEAFIYFENTQSDHRNPGVIQASTSQALSSQLIESLERITCLSLDVRDHYLRLYEPPRSLYASMNAIYRLDYAIPADRHCSSTAKDLLLSAIRDTSVYKVRENRGAALGRVSLNDYIELDFTDLKQIVYRDLPHEVFDIGMIFLHELAHRHLKLKDPSKEEIKNDSLVKGDTVSFINNIERELKLPQRRHYAPVKIRRINGETKWGIYYGNGTDRVELNPNFGLK
jgi:hypothetical protein